MKKAVLIMTLLVMGILLGACGSTRAFKNYVKSRANGGEIKIYARNTKNKKEVIYRIKEKEISMILSFVTDEEAPAYKCGYTGTIDFYNDGKSILEDKVDFNAGCGHAVISYGGSVLLRKLSPKGIQFFEKLQQQ